MDLSSRPLTLVAAVARNGAIGGGGRLLWRLRSDMRRFRAITMGKPVIMGRKTWESIGVPLAGRSIVVLTRVADYPSSGLALATDIPDALRKANDLADVSGASEIIVAGGGEVYLQTVDLATHMRLTEVDLAPAADAFFPQINQAVWREVARDTHPAGGDDEAAFAFVDYDRQPLNQPGASPTSGP
jgi:dihydrofolate reductase